MKNTAHFVSQPVFSGVLKPPIFAISEALIRLFGALRRKKHGGHGDSQPPCGSARAAPSPKSCAFFVVILLVLLAGCVGVHAESPARIALLAPFEGRYREIGYGALYPARLALDDLDRSDVTLLPIDDGGSAASATDRARALALDPLVKAVIVLGYDAAAPQTLDAFGDLPVIVVGNWRTAPLNANQFALALPPGEVDSERLDVTRAARLDAPLTGGEVLALEGFRRLRADLTGVTVISAGSLPGADFTARVMASDPFAVEPGLLATLVYDAVSVATHVIDGPRMARAQVAEKLRGVDFAGLNGRIRFDESGQWRDAPRNVFCYDAARQLVGC